MLEKYREKRDFDRTPEPPPDVPVDAQGPLMYVIQKHAATRLHYDFRLEFGGVLKSWPVPKGPSLDPAEKRLAVMVEDHPVDYAGFEGVIPKGEYGAGQVIVWDAGTYSPDEGGLVAFGDREEAERRMAEGLERGKLSFFLNGRRLKGSFTLVKTKRGEKDWLLIKHKDAWADPERKITEEDTSVVSGLSLADIVAGRLPDRRRDRLFVHPRDVPGAVPASFPARVEPMHAKLTDAPFSSEECYFDPKLDGVRAIVSIDGENIHLRSRRGLDTTRQYPAIVGELDLQVERRIVMDGEIVALDERGVPSFQTLQQRLNLARDADIRRMEEQIPVFLYVFDLLYADGYDLRGARLADRRDLLKQLLLPTAHVFLLEPFADDGVEAYEASVKLGLEGVMAKRKDSIYESGRRSNAWLKIKSTAADEFVVGGFSRGEGGRAATFGSLVIGQYDEQGRLVYAGNVGSGFDDRTLEYVRRALDGMIVDKSPFDVFEPGSTRFGRGAKESDIIWVRPELVVSVAFAEWTADGHLRAPTFRGFAEKAPKEVCRERTVPPPAVSVVGAAPAGGADGISDVLEQLGKDKDEFTLEVGREKVPLTNLDKVFWPEWKGRRALTKRDLLTYLAGISPYLLPHMRDRPLTLTRYPNGVKEQHFYQKHWEGNLPKFVSTVALWSGQNEKDGEYLICDNLATLMWLGQLADIELHTWYSRVSPETDGGHLPETYTGSDEQFEKSRLNYPDFIVFDLDPYIYSGQEKRGEEPELNRKAFNKTAEAALWLKELLDSLSLSSFVKTTGKTGLHVYVPILREFDYDTTRAAAETVGKFLLRAHPRDITMEWSTRKRTGKIFFDHNQNMKGKTLASIYSPRPVPWAGVSVPLRWDELTEAYPAEFTILNVVDRVKEKDDLWAGILDEKHDLGAILETAPNSS